MAQRSDLMHSLIAFALQCHFSVIGIRRHSLSEIAKGENNS